MRDELRLERFWVLSSTHVLPRGSEPAQWSATDVGTHETATRRVCPAGMVCPAGIVRVRVVAAAVP
jgi:hypothetical protein